jgi:hypothetical protein
MHLSENISGTVTTSSATQITNSTLYFLNSYGPITLPLRQVCALTMRYISQVGSALCKRWDQSIVAAKLRS